MDEFPPSLGSEGGSFVPPTSDIDGALRAYELQKGDHVERYRFASAHLGPGNVLDFGCGHGLGAFYLARSDRNYTGLDSDERAVRWASECILPRLTSVRFQLPSEFEQESHLHQFNSIVLMEVIEHVEQPELLLQQCLSLLADGGQLVISTPNGLLSEGSTSLHQSPYHVREFNAEEFGDLLLKSGFKAELYEQYRVDHLDSVPQLAKRALLGIPRLASGLGSVNASGGPERADRRHSARLTALYRVFRLAPGWSGLWRMRRFEAMRHRWWAYSHIVATARRQNHTIETALSGPRILSASTPRAAPT